LCAGSLFVSSKTIDIIHRKKNQIIDRSLPQIVLTSNNQQSQQVGLRSLPQLDHICLKLLSHTPSQITIHFEFCRYEISAMHLDIYFVQDTYQKII
jgi:hypothetical protein